MLHCFVLCCPRMPRDKLSVSKHRENMNCIWVLQFGVKTCLFQNIHMSEGIRVFYWTCLSECSLNFRKHQFPILADTPSIQMGFVFTAPLSPLYFPECPLGGTILNIGRIASTLQKIIHRNTCRHIPQMALATGERSSRNTASTFKEMRSQLGNGKSLNI